jgi:hypothetical protein
MFKLFLEVKATLPDKDLKTGRKKKTQKGRKQNKEQ